MAAKLMILNKYTKVRSTNAIGRLDSAVKPRNDRPKLVIPAHEPESIIWVALELKFNLEFNSCLLANLHRLPELVLMDSGSWAGMMNAGS